MPWRPLVLLQLAISMVGSLFPAYIEKSLQFTVNMDDCWQRSRDANGTIQPDPIDFPSGIPALVDYVHSRKLKFGLYSGTGVLTS